MEKILQICKVVNKMQQVITWKNTIDMQSTE